MNDSIYTPCFVRVSSLRFDLVIVLVSLIVSSFIYHSCCVVAGNVDPSSLDVDHYSTKSFILWNCSNVVITILLLLLLLIQIVNKSICLKSPGAGL